MSGIAQHTEVRSSPALSVLQKPRYQPLTDDVAENALLCCFMHSPGVVAGKCSQLSQAVFSTPGRQALYGVLSTWPYPEQPIDDIPWMERELQELGFLDEIGGRQGLTDIRDMPVSLILTDYYVSAVQVSFARRAFIKDATEKLELAKSGAPPIEWDPQGIYRAGLGDGLPEIKRLQDIVSENIPKPLEIIAGILHRGLKMMIGGPSKARKTWLFDAFGFSDCGRSVVDGMPLHKGIRPLH
jgi:hypothetical protein